MKLLLDQNISRKLIKELEELFPGSNHVYVLGLARSSDKEVWDYARDNAFTIVTQDSDFNERSLIYGYPPKVIWLRVGNTSTANVMLLLKQHWGMIVSFGKSKSLGCLQIFDR